MPRYRFRWEQVPESIRIALAESLGLTGPTDIALADHFGPTPSEDLIRGSWPALLDTWLADDDASRKVIFDRLQGRGFGKDRQAPRTVEEELEWLRACRKTKGLREVALDAFLVMGERAAADEPIKEPSISSALSWDDFTAQLASVLARLARENYLIVYVDDDGRDGSQDGDAPYYVQFAPGSEKGFRAEAVGNRYLIGFDRLSPEDERRMGALTWLSPDSETEGTGGDTNFYRDWPVPTPHAEIAEVAVRTLREIYRAESPSDLRYRAFDEQGRHFAVPGVDILPAAEDEPPASTRPTPATMAELRPGIESMLEQLLSRDRLEPDKAGDYPVRIGDAMVFVRLLDEPPLVHLFAPLVWGIPMTPQLLDAVNEANLRSPFARIVWTGKEVMALMDVPARGMRPEDLRFAMSMVGHVANSLDHELHAKFGGQVMFGEGRPPVQAGDSGYL